MKRVFITSISLQGRGGLERLVYHPVDFAFSKEERMTSFPIVPVIAEHLERREEIEIIAVRVQNKDTADNFESFVREIEELGLSKECIKVVKLPENQNIKTEVKLLMEIVDLIPNHSVLNACITFGMKPSSVITTYVLNFAEKLFSDVEVAGIYYGEIPRIEGRPRIDEARIYNLIGLLQVGNIIEQMNALRLDNPKESLKRLLNLD